MFTCCSNFKLHRPRKISSQPCEKKRLAAHNAVLPVGAFDTDRSQYALNCIFLQVMKTQFLLLFLGLQIHSYAQQTGDCDTTRYRIMLYDAMVEIEIKTAGEWRAFSLLDSTGGQFTWSCEEAELNQTGSKELVIRWSHAVYGTGGGTTTGGIQIWDLDKGVRILDEVVACSEENFGRGQGKSYFVHCQKEVIIQNGVIAIAPKACGVERSEMENPPDPTLNNPITSLRPGNYVFEHGRLIRQGSFSQP